MVATEWHDGRRLDGATAIVTGGAAGIGAAIAAMLARSGAQVFVADIAAADDAVGGAAITYMSCDVTDRASVAQAIATIVDDDRDIDVLVNCAGIVALAPAVELGFDDWARTIAVNLTGTFLVSQCVGSRMLQAGRGRIVNIASQAAHVALDQHAAYCASKAGVIGLTKVLASEWGPHGITVNSISPTVVLTELGRKAWDGPRGEALLRQIPTGRFALPEEIAAAVMYLVSPAAGMVNGADLAVDGGYTIR